MRIDYLRQPEELPMVIQEILEEYGEITELTYSECRDLLAQLEQNGWTFDYGLSAEPYNLRPIKPLKRKRR